MKIKKGSTLKERMEYSSILDNAIIIDENEEENKKQLSEEINSKSKDFLRTGKAPLSNDDLDLDCNTPKRSGNMSKGK